MKFFAAKQKIHFIITKINWFLPFTEVITDYCENHARPINTLCVQNAELVTGKSGGTYSYHCGLNC